jgi:hypothetical protein
MLVQSKTGRVGSATTITVTLDAPATPGNDVLVIVNPHGQTFTSMTFGGNAMTRDASLVFGTTGVWRYRVPSGGMTDAVLTVGAASSLVVGVLEVDPLPSSPYDSSNDQYLGEAGEGTSTNHSLDYVAANPSSLVCGWCSPDAGLINGTPNGATILSVTGTPEKIFYKFGCASGAGVISFTLDTAAVFRGLSYVYNDGGAAPGTQYDPITSVYPLH